MALSRTKRGDLSEEAHELNLVPYLDVMVNLVLFMLMNITGFLSFTVLNASIPQLAPPGAKATATGAQKKELLLMVRVTENQLLVDPSVQGGKSPDRRALPKKDGKFDFEALKQVAVELKTAFPEERRVLIIAQASIIYDDIIKTMDALRDHEEDGDDQLFPDVTLSIL